MFTLKISDQAKSLKWFNENIQGVFDQTRFEIDDLKKGPRISKQVWSKTFFSEKFVIGPNLLDRVTQSRQSPVNTYGSDIKHCVKVSMEKHFR